MINIPGRYFEYQMCVSAAASAIKPWPHPLPIEQVHNGAGEEKQARLNPQANVM